jgi:GMP synthase-like glutamine amidotransferase
MQVAILETGKPPEPLRERFGTYPRMFADLLGPGFDLVSYDVEAGELPEGEHPAYLVTGSAAGVYEARPWIEPLKAFLRGVKGKARLVGVCFGHQIMAEAFGGKVKKSERGWGVGLQRYEVLEHTPFMSGEDSVSIPVSHQDQIVTQPPATRILAASGFSPFGVLAYEDQPALSMQFHPEFSPEYAKALIELRRPILPDADLAIESLNGPNDRERVAEWLRKFLS